VLAPIFFLIHSHSHTRGGLINLHMLILFTFIALQKQFVRHWICGCCCCHCVFCFCFCFGSFAIHTTRLHSHLLGEDRSYGFVYEPHDAYGSTSPSPKNSLFSAPTTNPPLHVCRTSELCNKQMWVDVLAAVSNRKKVG